VLLCLVAIFAPLIVSDLNAVYDGDLVSRLQPPSAEFWFGTDSLGRDVFARVIVGSRGALAVALTVVSLAIAIGVPAGLYAGYSDGWGSQLVMRLTDVFLAVPQLILALAVAQLMGRGLGSAMAALALTYWPFFCRTVYGEVRRLRNELFIEAQRCLGASTSRILFVHVLPNVASAVIVRATIGMGFTIMTTAVLGFLGVGATPPKSGLGARHRGRAGLSAAILVGRDLSGARHLHHRIGLQSVRRRIARSRRSPAEALAMTPNAAPLLDIRNLSVSVATDEGEARILDRASLALMPGSIHGVVGESGLRKIDLDARHTRHPAQARTRHRRTDPAGRSRSSEKCRRMSSRTKFAAAGSASFPRSPYQALNPVFRVGTQLRIRRARKREQRQTPTSSRC